MSDIKLSKIDKIRAIITDIVEEITPFNGAKIGLCITAIGTGLIFASTETARKMAVNFINSTYDDFRKKYGISEDEWIYIGRKGIEFINEKE